MDEHGDNRSAVGRRHTGPTLSSASEDGGDVNSSPFVVRNLTQADQGRLTAIDQAITGRRREMWYQRKLERALSGSDVAVSLGAEHDGLLVGALLGSVHYGEFGQPEPVAVLDTVLVDREYGGRGVASALFDQLQKNLIGLRIERVRTEVAWNEHELLGFFASRGFTPVPRLVLELELGGDDV